MRLSIAFFLILFTACGKNGSTASPDPAVRSLNSGPRNYHIDLTVPASPEPSTDAKIFDESVIFAPNFAINQRDPALSDIFSSKGVSELCVPTALAESLIYLDAYGPSPLHALQLAGLSGGQRSVDANALVRELAHECKTDWDRGTNWNNAAACVDTLYARSGFPARHVQRITPWDSGANVVNRDLMIQDLREALKKNLPILLNVQWRKYINGQWVWQAGHTFSVFGYDYDNSWGENQIQLKVINPETNYGNTRGGAIWDTVTMIRIAPKPGMNYPAHEPFFMTGTGFGGLDQRAFIDMMMIL